MAETSNRRTKRAEGQTYEDKAVEYIQGLGYRVLDRNRTYRVGELDIVAEEVNSRGITLVFVEVRKRAALSWLAPQETVTQAKQKRILRAIQLYLLSYSGVAKSLRIDLIGFEENKLIHFQNFL